MNTFGNIFTLTTFGESHGEAIGGVVDGMPAGIDIDTDFIQQELNRRRPGQSRITTSRRRQTRWNCSAACLKARRQAAPSASSYATPTSTRRTMRICAACSDRRMPTIPTS